MTEETADKRAFAGHTNDDAVDGRNGGKEVSASVGAANSTWAVAHPHGHSRQAVTGEADKRAAFAAADLALAASGTVSLELAANGVPMVIGYDMAPLSRMLIGMLLKTDTVTLVNLVSETRAVPEFLGSRCQPGPMAQALQDALENRAKRGAQLDAMDLTMDRLGKGGEAPGLRAARSVLQAITGPR